MFRSKSVVGVDIGSNVVKVAQVRRSGQEFELEKVGMATIYPDGEKPSESRAQRAAKVEAVKRALSEARITARHSVSGVSGESIIVRYLQLPDMPEDELKKALQWEAEEYIPFRLDEVNIDSIVLGKSEEDDTRVDVLLVSAKKDLVENHLSIIREAGLTPRIVEVDSFAFQNCYEANYGEIDDCVALINIGAEITGISIYHRGVSRFSRDIPIGGETITTGIRSHLRCSHREAEDLKIIQGAHVPEASAQADQDSPSGGLMDTIRGTVEEMTGDKIDESHKVEIVARAVDGVVGDLISETRRSVEFFENQMRDGTVNRLVLGGGGCRLSGLLERFEAEFSLPVEYIDPLRKVNPKGRDANASVIDGRRESLGVGVGLAIRGLAA